MSQKGVSTTGREHVLEISVYNVVIMQVLHAGQYGSDNRDSISLGKAATLANSLKKFSTDCELESKIVR
jgi:hypothetical protein